MSKEKSTELILLVVLIGIFAWAGVGSLFYFFLQKKLITYVGDSSSYCHESFLLKVTNSGSVKEWGETLWGNEKNKRFFTFYRVGYSHGRYWNPGNDIVVETEVRYNQRKSTIIIPVTLTVSTNKDWSYQEVYDNIIQTMEDSSKTCYLDVFIRKTFIASVKENMNGPLGLGVIIVGIANSTHNEVDFIEELREITKFPKGKNFTNIIFRTEVPEYKSCKPLSG